MIPRTASQRHSQDSTECHISPLGALPFLRISAHPNIWECLCLPEGYNIEYYSNAADYEAGTQDPAYYAEVWIPVKEKQ